MPGCLLDLVPAANKFGFYWGDHFTRRDGMHFEVAKLVELSRAVALDYPPRARAAVIGFHRACRPALA
jgi:hypothetical protein